MQKNKVRAPVCDHRPDLQTLPLPPSCRAGVGCVNGPAVFTDLGAEPSCLFGLYHTGMARPAYGLQVARIVKKVEVAFVRLDVVDHC